MRILVLDNYDSFTYNLVHILRDLGYSPDVLRNDKISVAAAAGYDRILLSPGPGLPSDAGIMPELIRSLSPSSSILGVCLGLQGIAEAFGGKLFNLPDVLHGVTSVMSVADRENRIFRGLPEQIRVTHYHSWAVSPDYVPADMQVTAMSGDTIMAMSHRHYDVHGVQFHPEAVMTEFGAEMIANWLNQNQSA